MVVVTHQPTTRLDCHHELVYKELLRRSHKNNVWACELSIKRGMKKKDNGEVYRLRWQAQEDFAVFHLVPLRFWKRS